MFAIRRERDEFARRPLARCQLRAADPEGNGGIALECGDADLLEPAAVVLRPREILTRQESRDAR